MSRYLNVGIIQMPVSEETAENLAYLEERVAAMMGGCRRPELIVGVESIASWTPQTIPGELTEYFSKIAKKYGIYFIPGTICEKSDDLPEGKFYNTAPIFDPEGNLIDIYRKMVPWRPVEEMIEPGNKYVVFDIPEKNTKVGVQICYDLNFPEISRNEVLMGAEVLVKLTLDPLELHRLNQPIHYARALENQAYLVSTNGAGFHRGIKLCGHSMVIDPQGQCLWEAEDTEAVGVITLDLDLVGRCRKYGTMFIEHYLQHIREYPLPMPFAGRIEEAPLFQTLEKMPQTEKTYEQAMGLDKLFSVGRQVENLPHAADIQRNLEKFLKEKESTSKE